MVNKIQDLLTQAQEAVSSPQEIHTLHKSLSASSSVETVFQDPSSQSLMTQQQKLEEELPQLLPCLKDACVALIQLQVAFARLSVSMSVLICLFCVETWVYCIFRAYKIFIGGQK
jgi:HPt (histidine-containing phosphotransfer) domain-containing protein